MASERLRILIRSRFPSTTSFFTRVAAQPRAGSQPSWLRAVAVVSHALLAAALLTGLLATGLEISSPHSGPATMGYVSPRPAAQRPAAQRPAPARVTAPGRPGTARPARLDRPAGPVLVSALSAAKPVRERAAGIRPATRAYTVQPGDSLSAIAQRFYGQSADWGVLYRANRSRIADPGLIYPGEVLAVPPGPPASLPAGDLASYHGPASTAGAASGRRAASRALQTSAAPASSTGTGGAIGCAGLEALWERAGGSPASAALAAAIAMAESGGSQYATGSAGERGYWQINPVNGALSTYDPYGNARAAVILSGGGTDWSPWTTYTSGAYQGRC
jgi:LysM repeat protein